MLFLLGLIECTRNLSALLKKMGTLPPTVYKRAELVFLKIHGARCGVEKETQMGGLLGGEGLNSFLLV
jgi:hypothetical protein